MDLIFVDLIQRNTTGEANKRRVALGMILRQSFKRPVSSWTESWRLPTRLKLAVIKNTYDNRE